MRCVMEMMFIMTMVTWKSMRSLPSQGSSMERATSSHPMKKTNLGMRTMEQIVIVIIILLVALNEEDGDF